MGGNDEPYLTYPKKDIMKKYKDSPYYVTSDGRVYRDGRQLKMELNRGYQRVTLSYNGLLERIFVHRLVAELYIPNPENKPFVNHINHIRNDNRVENLEWVTHSENMLHCVGHNRGTHKMATEASVVKNDERMIEKYKEILGDLFISTEKRYFEKIGRTRRFVIFKCCMCGEETEARSDSTTILDKNFLCSNCR